MSSDDRSSNGAIERSSRDHSLVVENIFLVNGGRSVALQPGINIVRGDITTGKTTFVRLIRALLATVSKNLPPEVDDVTALQGRVQIRARKWDIYRPLVTTAKAPVQIAEVPRAGDKREVETIQLPATGFEGSYSRFLLDLLRLPAVTVPRGRKDPDSTFSPITMTDWLGYCIVTGDEIDLQVFGHRDSWRDQKRRWIFELTYGLYDTNRANLVADLRRIELQIEAIEKQAEIVAKFLSGTPFSDRALIDESISERQRTLEELAQKDRQISQDALTVAPEISGMRAELLEERSGLDRRAAEIRNTRNQIRDLDDLVRQLKSQSARLTRAIVADEWLVDFDFIVCPRCGTSVESSRSSEDQCYLCLQHPHSIVTQDSLLAEQSRVVAQVQETIEVLDSRRRSLDELEAAQASGIAALSSLSTRLDLAMDSFVSNRASQMRENAAARVEIESDIRRLGEYRELFRRYDEITSTLDDLNQRRDEVEALMASEADTTAEAEPNIIALEQRTLEYLSELHIPQLGDLLSVTINRSTYLPEISGRKFDELSSQGLKTLVNVAHSLAHHTVAIDRGLPLPGLLILDGLSANAGKEGFDADRLNDMYRLLISVSEQYEDRLQVIAVDNAIPEFAAAELADRIVLTLSQTDRLIRNAPGML